MKLIHFLNSIALFCLILLFLLGKTYIGDTNNLHELMQDKSGIQKAKMKIGWYAKMSGEELMDNKLAHQIAFALFALNLFTWPMMVLFSKKRSNRITLDVPGGKVSITLLAIEDSLRRSLKGDPQIKDSKVIVSPQGRSISVTAKVTLLESENLHHLDEKIIAHLKNHFEKIFPIQQPVSYEVVINKLKATGTPMGVNVSSPSPAITTPLSVQQPLYPNLNAIEKDPE